MARRHLITATNYGVSSVRLFALHLAYTDLSPSLSRAGKTPELWLRAQVLALVQALQMQLALMPQVLVRLPQPQEPVLRQLRGLEPLQPQEPLALLVFPVWLLVQ